jgi:hypothetical protein
MRCARTGRPDGVPADRIDDDDDDASESVRATVRRVRVGARDGPTDASESDARRRRSVR